MPLRITVWSSTTNTRIMATVRPFLLDWQVGQQGRTRATGIPRKAFTASRMALSFSLDFDDLVFNSVSYQLAHGMQLEFSHDVCAVRFSGFHADVEDHGNLFAALSFGEELHDLSLAACQSISGK